MLYVIPEVSHNNDNAHLPVYILHTALTPAKLQVAHIKARPPCRLVFGVTAKGSPPESTCCCSGDHLQGQSADPGHPCQIDYLHLSFVPSVSLLVCSTVVLECELNYVQLTQPGTKVPSCIRHVPPCSTLIPPDIAACVRHVQACVRLFPACVRQVPAYIRSQHASDWSQHSSGPCMHQTGPSMRQTSPSMRQAGPSMRQTGPSMRQTDPSIHQTGPSMLLVPACFRLVPLDVAVCVRLVPQDVAAYVRLVPPDMSLHAPDRLPLWIVPYLNCLYCGAFTLS